MLLNIKMLLQTFYMLQTYNSDNEIIIKSIDN